MLGQPSVWSKTLHINAQAKRIQQTNTFEPLPGQRCRVPMAGFYEWKSDKSPCVSSAAIPCVVPARNDSTLA